MSGWQRFLLLTAILLLLPFEVGAASVEFLRVARSAHTATLLPSGKILVVGGFNNTYPASAELYDPATGAWEITGSLKVPRSQHTATLLLSGKVLVVGGENRDDNFLASAELYDPSTGEWTSILPLIQARREHTASLLASGKVLVVGGQSPGGHLTSVEIYDPTDPAGPAWRAAAPIEPGRSDHTATLLFESGQVLVAGGYDGSALVSAQLYDPDLDRWTVVGGLRSARRQHTSTLLPDGKVLVVGGRNTDELNHAELYDPATRSWIETAGVLTDPRRDHTATLLPSGEVFIAGGHSGQKLASIELYHSFDPNDPDDPDTDRFTPQTPLEVPRREHTATLLPSGDVLLVGGFNVDYLSSAETVDSTESRRSSWPDIDLRRYLHSATLLLTGEVLLAGGTNGNALSGSERWDPTQGRWIATTGILAERRYQHTATLLQTGEVLVVGGFDPSPSPTRLRSAELYRRADDRWFSVGALGEGRQLHTATRLPSGQVLVVGGSGNAGPLASSELYDPTGRAWIPTAESLATPRSLHTATLLSSGKVLVAGGLDNSPLRGAEIYDPIADTWRSAGLFNEPRRSHTATLLPSGRVLIVGGLNGVPLASSEIYDPATETWQRTGSLAIARYGHVAALLPSGKVLVVGGLGIDANGGTELASAEVYDPASRLWTSGESLATARHDPTVTLLPDGSVLVVGGDGPSLGALDTAELYEFDLLPDARRPIVLTHTQPIRYGDPENPADAVEITGEGLRGDSEGSGGGTWSSAVDRPVVRLRAWDGSYQATLEPDAVPALFDDPMKLTMSELPPSLHPGRHLLTVVAGGVPSLARPVDVECGLTVERPVMTKPVDQTPAIDETATFEVETQGGRRFRWQKNGEDISGADDAASYTTPPLTAIDSGSTYRVVVDSGCTNATSPETTLIVEDQEPPTAQVVSPDGGEFWLLSDERETNRELLTWEMADNIRVCHVEVRLLFSPDGVGAYQPVPDDLLFEEGPGPGCRDGDEPTTTHLELTAPTTPPSGTPGSLYKIEVTVEDHAGLVTAVESPRPFFIVQPNPESVNTLILTNVGRMGVSADAGDALVARLWELADHPRVLGRIIDLDGVTDLSAPGDGLYALWDADLDDPEKANRVLFGCHGVPLPIGCPIERNGIRDHLRDLLEIFTEVEYLVLVGDDRVIPMARVMDETFLLPESSYPAGGDLTPAGTTVGRAITADRLLTDDLLAVRGTVDLDNIQDGRFLPDLSVGRLVETPSEITTTIATFISQGGFLDLASLDPVSGHKVLVTGYDFLIDSGRRIRGRWRQALGLPERPEDVTLAPVDGELLTRDWGIPDEAVSDRQDELEIHLGGHGGPRYGVVSLNGHANHYEEGVPGQGFSDIQGLDTTRIDQLDLVGSVVYAVGCHGGLPVAGDTTSGDHPLDLPQTLLRRGVQVYVANSGYGWGLVHGIGYSERLVEIFTEEMTAGGIVVMGQAVRAAKQRYFLEAPSLDPYDKKTLLQWTTFGLPMYAVKTGIIPSGTENVTSAAELLAKGHRVREHLGLVVVDRTSVDSKTLPAFLTQISHRFDFSAPGVYAKRDALGEVIEDPAPGCPVPPPGESPGCYYTLTDLAERSTGTADLPIQPYFVFESRLANNSLHGVLWLGGAYIQEESWAPVVSQLASNLEPGYDQGSTPRFIRRKLRPSRRPLSREGLDCVSADEESSSLVVVTGEALKKRTTDTTFNMERRFTDVGIEAFYFNNTRTGSGNCDRLGPDLEAGVDYHQVVDNHVDWAVALNDADVWRVVVVFTDGRLDAQGRGSWRPLELVDDGTGTWRGSLPFPGTPSLTYVIQAVDLHGNVSWLDGETVLGSESGVEPDLARVVEVPFDVTGTCAAVRGLPTGYVAGEPVPVSLDVRPESSAMVYAVEETPPAGWTVDGVSHGGVLDSMTGAVKWGPFFDSTFRILTYQATPPSASAGAGFFSGVLSVDGQSEPICGPMTLDPGGFHPADLDEDWRVGISETTGYGAAWRSGQPWANPPNPIPIDHVTNAGLLWLSGEIYHFDNTLDPPWAPGATRASRFSPFVGRVTGRFDPPFFTPDQAVTVTLTVTPDSRSLNYAVEDSPPADWRIVAISDSGALDAVHGKVKWGPFDSRVRELSYTAIPAAGAVSVFFDGQASFDGASVRIEGGRTLERAVHARKTVVFANGDAQPDRVCVDDRGGLVCAELEQAAVDSSGVVMGWLDGDALPDIVLANADGRNRICLGRDAGGFTCEDIDSYAVRTTAVALGQLNRDAYADLVFANHGAPDRVCLGDGVGGFACRDVGASRHSLDVAVSRIDGDLVPDLVFADDGANRVCLGDRDGDDVRFTCTELEPLAVSSRGVAVGDLDGDHHADVVFADGRLCLGDGAGGFACRDEDLGTTAGRALDLGRIDADAHLDAVIATGSADPDRVCLGDGAGRFVCQALDTTPRDARDVVLVRLDRDARLDAVFAHVGERNTVCLGDGLGGFSCQPVGRESELSHGVAVEPAPGSIFSDGFESGGLAAWLRTVP